MVAAADAGIGAGFEYDELDLGPEVMVKQCRPRLRWRLTD